MKLKLVIPEVLYQAFHSAWSKIPCSIIFLVLQSQIKSNPGREALVRTKELIETWFSLFFIKPNAVTKSASRDGRIGMQVTASFVWSSCMWYFKQYHARVGFKGYSDSAASVILILKKATGDNWLQTQLFDLLNLTTKNCHISWFNAPYAHYSGINYRKSAKTGVEVLRQPLGYCSSYSPNFKHPLRI